MVAIRRCRFSGRKPLATHQGRVLASEAARDTLLPVARVGSRSRHTAAGASGRKPDATQQCQLLGWEAGREPRTFSYRRCPGGDLSWYGGSQVVRRISGCTADLRLYGGARVVRRSSGRGAALRSAHLANGFRFSRQARGHEGGGARCTRPARASSRVSAAQSADEPPRGDGRLQAVVGQCKN